MGFPDLFIATFISNSKVIIINNCDFDVVESLNCLFVFGKLKRDNRHFDVMATKKVESLHCLFVFGTMKRYFSQREIKTVKTTKYDSTHGLQEDEITFLPKTSSIQLMPRNPYLFG